MGQTKHLRTIKVFYQWIISYKIYKMKRYKIEGNQWTQNKETVTKMVNQILNFLHNKQMQVQT